MKNSAGVLRSVDGGKKWSLHGGLTHPSTWLIENTLVERRDGCGTRRGRFALTRAESPPKYSAPPRQREAVTAQRRAPPEHLR